MKGKEVAVLLVLLTPKELEEWHRLQQKSWNTTSLSNRKGWPPHHEMSNWKGHCSLLCRKKKNKVIGPNHKMMKRQRFKGGKEPSQPKKRWIRARAWSRQSQLQAEGKWIPMENEGKQREPL